MSINTAKRNETSKSLRKLMEVTLTWGKLENALVRTFLEKEKVSLNRGSPEKLIGLHWDYPVGWWLPGAKRGLINEDILRN